MPDAHRWAVECSPIYVYILYYIVILCIYIQRYAAARRLTLVNVIGNANGGRFTVSTFTVRIMYKYFMQCDERLARGWKSASGTHAAGAKVCLFLTKWEKNPAVLPVNASESEEINKEKKFRRDCRREELGRKEKIVKKK